MSTPINTKVLEDRLKDSVLAAVKTSDPLSVKKSEPTSLKTSDPFSVKSPEPVSTKTSEDRMRSSEPIGLKTSDPVSVKSPEPISTKTSEDQLKTSETFSMKTTASSETYSLKTLEDCLKNVPAEDLKDLKTHIYGRSDDCELPISPKSKKIADDNKFVIKSYKFDAIKEDLRKPRIVRIGAIQTSLAAPTTDPVGVQRQKIFEKVAKIIEAAASENVNVLCLQELWYLPYVFCTREKYPWSEFAENPETGAAVTFLSNYARKYNMVIVSPILERDEDQGDIVWNSAVVISNSGNIIGKHRKNHIPRVGDFNESTYYFEGNSGHPVFETQFGKIAINICYGRHHPQNWMMFGLNGAEIVFNPSAEIGGSLSDRMWFIEGRNAAVANSYFTVTINRVGTEVFTNEFTSADGKKAHKDMGPFYGSAYLATPEGYRSPGMPRNTDGLLINEVDLNQCRQSRDLHTFRMCQRLPIYAEGLARACKLDFKPQIVREN